MNTRALGTLAVAVFMLGCHTITEELPTQPSKAPSNKGVVTIAIPVIPGATPAPAPVPTPAPTATPGPNPTAPPPAPPPNTGNCGNPIPPPVSRMNTKIHIRGVNRWVLDTTPLVGPDGDYCRKIGFTDGRLFCAVRTEGTPDREACEAYAIGRATDTGRPGPTWYRNGKLCNGTDCENHEENQYLLYVMLGGRYEACSKDGVCGAVDADR